MHGVRSMVPAVLQLLKPSVEACRLSPHVANTLMLTPDFALDALLALAQRIAQPAYMFLQNAQTVCVLVGCIAKPQGIESTIRGSPTIILVHAWMFAMRRAQNLAPPAAIALRRALHGQRRTDAKAAKANAGQDDRCQSNAPDGAGRGQHEEAAAKS